MNKTIALFQDIAKILTPPPKMTVSDWADENRVLSREASAEAGKWRTSRAEYQREIMNAANDPETERVVVMTSSQIGKSEIINNVVGYFVDYDPAPIMLVQPTLDVAKAYSKDRIDPMIRDTPALRKKVAGSKARDGDNTILHKRFPGGHITLVGANSPSSLASRPIRILLMDEVDRYPVSAGEEGDPAGLAIKRTTTFWNKKIYMVSTPTIKGASRIEAEYEDSTMEQWQVKCPACGKYMPYTWAAINFDGPVMECMHCKESFDEYTWKNQPGMWIPRAENFGVRGFHLNELASPWVKWEKIIENFKEAKRKGQETLKTWINTSLGETWEEKSDTDSSEIIKRRERYNADLPDGVLLLTCGVDVQDDRLELEVVGWGHGKESWGIEYQMFVGDTSQDAVWTQLDNYLTKQFKFEDNKGLHITTTCIDSGGHRTQEVYKFCKTREHRRIFAIKGRGGEGVPFISAPTRNNRERVALFTIGVDQGKMTLISRLKQQFEGEGYCHFPIEQDKGYDEDYFEGITAESMRIRKVKGVTKVEWVKRDGVRNEAFDCRNYATAAMEIFNPDFNYLERNLSDLEPYAQAPIKRNKRKVISKGI